MISLCGVVVRCGRVERMLPGSSPTEFLNVLLLSFFFFSVFGVVVFYKHIAK